MDPWIFPPPNILFLCIIISNSILFLSLLGLSCDLFLFEAWVSNWQLLFMHKSTLSSSHQHSLQSLHKSPIWFFIEKILRSCDKSLITLHYSHHDFVLVPVFCFMVGLLSVTPICQHCFSLVTIVCTSCVTWLTLFSTWLCGMHEMYSILLYF